MEKYQIDQSFRLEPTFGLEDWKAFLASVIDQMAYDEDTLFEMVTEDSQLRRRLDEVPWGELSGYLTPALWDSFHQMVLSNHWIKGMNIKFHLVKRPDHLNLSIKCGLDDMAQRQMLEDKIQYLLIAAQSPKGMSGPTVEDLEALFGAMLLTESVAAKTKNSFMKGDMQSCLKAAKDIILDALFSKTGISRGRTFEVINLFTQQTPYLLLPNLSGPRLRDELEGLAHLLVGTVSVMKAILDYKDHVLKEPPQILKYLVLTSMIMDRFENTVKNPAYHEAEQEAVVMTPAPVKKKTVVKKKTKVTKKSKPLSRTGKKTLAPKPKGAVKKAAVKKKTKTIKSAAKAGLKKSTKTSRKPKAVSRRTRSSKRA